MHRSYQYLIHPTAAQCNCLEQMLDDTRSLYNCALEERVWARRQSGKKISFFEQSLHLKTVRADDPSGIGRWAQNVGIRTLRRLDKAFKSLSRHGQGFPRYRSSRRWNTVELAYGSGFKILRDRKLRVLGLQGSVCVNWHRDLPPDAKLGTTYITRRAGRWYVTFSLEANFQEECGSGAVGVDLGLISLFATSDGHKEPVKKHERRAHKRIRVLQQALARAKRGSKRRAKTRERLAAAHAKVARQRADSNHKLSRRLVRQHHTIIFENLAVERMKRSRFGRSISDAGWSQLVTFTRYKAESAGGRVVLVDPAYTSQDCPDCGRREKKPLSLRRHLCGCGCDLDRDVAAAKVILQRAGLQPSGHKAVGCDVPVPKSLNV